MFTEKYIDFFKNLSANNNIEWFNQNKPIYEKEVKKPFEKFIENLIDEIQQITPEIAIKPQEAIFRINKDVRFSSDKTPYKTEMSAVISKNGKKSNPCPGLYINIGAEKVIVAAGLKMLEKNDLNELRFYIANHLDRFNLVIQDKTFVEVFGEVQGEKIKRLPDDLKKAAEIQPLLFNTSFLIQKEIPAESILNPDFTKTVVQLYRLSLPFSMFLKGAIN